MLRPRAQAVARTPSAHPELTALVIGHKPVVGLLLLTSADVTRYCLPDHLFSPKSAQSFRGFDNSNGSITIAFGSESGEYRRSPPASDGRTIEIALLYFIARREEEMRPDRRESWGKSNRDDWKRNVLKWDTPGKMARNFPQAGSSLHQAPATIAVARNSPSWPAPDSAGRCSRDKSAGKLRHI